MRTPLALTLVLTGCIDLRAADEVDPLAPYDEERIVDESIPPWVATLDLERWSTADGRRLAPIAQRYGEQHWVLGGPELIHVAYDTADYGRLTGDMPEWTRLLPVVDEVVFGHFGAVVPPDEQRAYILEWDDAVTTLPLENAAAQLDAAASLDATVALRWMKTCPISRQTCLLYGPPAAVALAVDPLAPLGGFSLEEVEPREGAFAAADEVGALEQRAVNLTLRYAWDAATLTMTMAYEDRPGHQVGDGWAVRAVEYNELPIPRRFPFARLIFVDTIDGLELALHQGDETALLFTPGERDGRIVRVDIPSDLARTGSTMFDYPAHYTLEGETLTPVGDDPWGPLRAGLDEFLADTNCAG